MGGVELFEQGECFFFKLPCAVIVGDFEDTDHIVFDVASEFGVGGVGADGQVFIELSGVGGDNGAAVMFGQSEAEFGFAHAGGSQQYDKGGFHLGIVVVGIIVVQSAEAFVV